MDSNSKEYDLDMFVPLKLKTRKRKQADLGLGPAPKRIAPNLNNNETSVQSNFVPFKLKKKSQRENPTREENATFQNKPAHEIGFKNIGNSCYLSAVLQSLTGIPQIINESYNFQTLLSTFNEEAEIMKSNGKIFREINRFFLYYSVGNEASTNDTIVKIKTELEKIDAAFSGRRMQDANEFFIRLIDVVSESCDSILKKYMDKIIKSKNGIEFRLENYMKNNYEFERQETFECCKCSYKSQNNFKEVNFWLDISETTSSSQTFSMQEIIDTQMKQELREKRCEKCGYEKSIVTTKIVKLPKVMVFFVKRYSYNEGRNQKVQKKIEIPKQVNFDKLLIQDYKEPDTNVPEVIYLEDDTIPKKRRNRKTGQGPLSSKFNLLSVVTHQGKSGSTGHYVSDVFR